MIQQKENDWVLNLLNNQEFSVSDFKDVGLNADNTSLLPEDVYKQSKLIQDVFKKEDGTFDDVTFHKFYENAELMYNAMSNDTMMLSFNELAAIYGKDNLFVSEDRKRSFDETVYYNRVPNPDRTTTGIIRVGLTAEPRLSQSELALTQKVLANPTEVYDSEGNPDWSKAVWHDAPNDSWFTDFTDTRVLAQWESDGEHIDPITGNTVKHAKGQLKLNEEGTYFYENLDGRDIYGKLVLNKMNTLTTDGSFWNKYDFFDSDDLEQKSFGGSIMKNAALVGSMFIPYVGPWIAGLSVASLIIGLTGTLGKMLTGSDSPTFSAMEGWAKSVNRQTAKSQYAMENTWCWENFINLIGDVAGQLKEQRFLFEFAPAIIKGNKILGANGVSESKKKLLIDKYTEKLNNIKLAKMSEMQKVRAFNQAELESFKASIAANPIMAAKDVENFTKSYFKIGEILSKGYMTAITVGDTYGELKYEGKASDIEATLFTLGYAAAELALLNSDIGSWILPELKASGMQAKAIVKAVAKVPDKYRIRSNSMPKETKKDLVKYWFLKGKETAEGLYDGSSSLLGQAMVGAISEGIEETSEELLGDFAKQCYNTYQWLQGDETKRVSAWDNMLDRYTMSLVGGAVGGGLTAVGTNFKTAMKPLQYEEAMQQLVFMAREGKLDEIRKAIDKVQLNDKNTSFETIQQSDGTYVDKAVTDQSKSKDADVKNVFHKMIDNIEYIIKAEGLNISDNAFIDSNTFKELRLSVLQLSPITGLLLQEFNNLSVDTAKIVQEINNLNAKKKDGDEFTVEQQATYDILTKLLEGIRLKRDAMLNGDMAMDYISLSLFDLTKAVSGKFGPAFFKDYVLQKHHLDVDTLDEETKEKYKKEYETWVNTEGKNEIATNGKLFLELARNSKQFIQEFSSNYDLVKNSKSIQDYYKSKQNYNAQLSALDQNADDPEIWFELFKDAQTKESLKNIHFLTQKRLVQRHEDIMNGIGLERQIEMIQNNSRLSDEDKELAIFNLKKKTIVNEFNAELLSDLDNAFSDFISAGVINPEIKGSLQNTLNDLETWVSGLSNNYSNLIQGYFEDDLLIETPLLRTNIQDIVESLSLLGVNKDIDEVTVKDVKLLEDLKRKAVNKIKNKKAELDNVGYTDIIGFIDNFIRINSESNLDIANLINTINGLLYQNKTNLENIDLGSQVAQIREALKVLNWVEGLVLAAQTDPETSLDNLSGYNVTLNEIAKKYRKEWEELPEITVKDSLIILQDISLIKSKLEQAQTLYYINSNQKEVSLKNANTNLHIINYKRLARFIVNIDDSWAEKNKLVAALDNAKTLANADLSSLSEELRKAIIQESIVIDDAIYDFFNANQLTTEKVATLFLKDYNHFDNSNQLINAGTEVLSDRNFLSYLSSRAALKRSNFIFEYRLTFDPEVIPFDIQEEAIYQTLADTANKKITNLFVEALEISAKESWKSKSTEERVNVLKRLKANEDLATNDDPFSVLDILPKYSNIFLIEGLPGAGKTNAVQYYVSKILQTFHKDIVANAWAAHTSEDTARNFASKSIKLDAKKHLSKESLMQLIYSKYKTDRELTEDGAYVYDTDELDEDFHFNDVSDSIADPPSIIFIDEISHYTQPELELLDDFAKRNKISIVTSGDFNQSTTTAEVIRGGKTYTLTNNHTLFKHSPKLGISIRTNNALLDKTIAMYLSRLSVKDLIYTYFYEDESVGLNGVKHTDNLTDLEKSIELMINTLDQNYGDGKIGLVYYDDNSPLVKLIDEKYSDKFTKKKGTSAQGLEGQYYIVDLQGASGDKIKQQKDLYTGITRAQQGAIIFGKNELIKCFLEDVTYTSTRKNYPNLAKSKIELYNSLKLDSGITLEENAKARKKVVKVNGTETTVEFLDEGAEVEGGSWAKPDNVITIIYRGEKYASDGIKVGKVSKEGKVTILADDDTTATEILDILENYEPVLTDIPPTEEEIDSLQPVIFPENFNQLFHSFNTAQHAAAVQTNPKGELDKTLSPVLVGGHDKRHDYRIDGFIGLARTLDDWDKNGYSGKHSYQFYEDKYERIQNALLSYESDNELAAAIQHILNESEDKRTGLNIIDNINNIEFGIFSSPGVSKGNTWGSRAVGPVSVFDKHKDEKDANVRDKDEDGDEDYNDLNRKTVGATIYVTTKTGQKKRLYIPLFVLGNLRTWLVNPDKSSFGKYLKAINDKVGGNVYKFHKEVANSTDPKIPDHVKHLAKFFLFTSGGWFKFKPDWRPRAKLQNWGIQVNTNAVSGVKYPWSGAGKYKSVRSQQKNGIRFSKNIYSANKKIDVNGSPLYIAPRGHSFILTTKSPIYRTDKALIDRYIEQLKNPKLHKDVTLVLISTPKVPIDTYLTNLHQIIIGDKAAKRLGNNFSSFRIWEALLSKDSTLTSFNLGLSEDKINFIKEQVEKIKKLSSKEDQKNALLTTVEFKETGAQFSRKKSTRDWLNFYLNQIIVKETNRDEIDTTKLTKLADHIKSAGIKEIHYSHKFKDIDKAGPVSEMELDFNSNDPLYTIEGLDFTMNAKLDSYMFAGDFNEELEEIVGKIDESGSVPISEDSSDYMMWPHNKDKNEGEGEPPTAPSTGSEPTSNLLNEKTISGFIVKEERQTDNTSKVFINGKEITGHSFDTVVDFIENYIPHKDARNRLQLNSLSILKSEDMDDDLLKRIYNDFKNDPQDWLDSDILDSFSYILEEYNSSRSNFKYFYDNNNQEFKKFLLPGATVLPLSKDTASILLSPKGGGSEIRIDLGSTVLTIERIGVENINVKLVSKTTSESSNTININGTEYNESILEKELTDSDVLNLLLNSSRELTQFIDTLSGATTMNYVLNQYKSSKELNGDLGIPFTEIKELEELLKLEKLTCNIS